MNMASATVKTKAAPKRTATKAPAKAAVKTVVKEEVKETKGALAAQKVKRLGRLHDVISKHETTAKEARTERDQIILEEIKGGASVSAVAEAAGVTRQHVYKNILEKKA
jgi:DNA invertase Pin-like site-specific DNA recombinase